jgi:hypothetical protein
MSSRPFARNAAHTIISGVTNLGDISVGDTAQDYSARPGGLTWWMGPDEADGYVIAAPVAAENQSTPTGAIGTVQFWKSTALTDPSFISIANYIKRTFGGASDLTTAAGAKTWLNDNGYWTSYGSSDVDYQAILTKATALGYTLPSAGQQTKQNQLILDLKAAGVWTMLDVLYMFATDGNNSFATLNWKNPNSNQCTLVNTPTFTTNQGFTGNGTSSYINTNYNPSTFSSPNYLLNSASLGWWKRTAGTSSSSKAIVSVASARINITNSSSGYHMFNTTFGSGVGQTPSTDFRPTGFALASKTGSLAGTNYVVTTPRIYTVVGGATDVLPATNILLLSSNGSAGFLDAQLSYFFAGSNLNSYYSPIYTAFTNYINTI